MVWFGVGHYEFKVLLYILEARAQVDRHVLVPLLKTVVLLDVVQVLATDHDGPLHLHLNNHAREDATTDADVPSEWAFLVNVGANGGLKHSTMVK